MNGSESGIYIGYMIHEIQRLINILAFSVRKRG